MLSPGTDSAALRHTPGGWSHKFRPAGHAAAKVILLGVIFRNECPVWPMATR